MCKANPKTPNVDPASNADAFSNKTLLLLKLKQPLIEEAMSTEQNIANENIEKSSRPNTPTNPIVTKSTRIIFWGGLRLLLASLDEISVTTYKAIPMHKNGIHPSIKENGKKRPANERYGSE